MKQKQKVSPLQMGVGGMGAQLLVLMVGLMSAWGFLANDEQWKINRGVLMDWEAKQMIETAVSSGDWKTAEAIYSRKVGSGVLGANTEIEAIIWPERQIENEIKYWSEVVVKTPSRYGYQKLSELYSKLGREMEARESLKKAGEVDPNDVTVVGY